MSSRKPSSLSPSEGGSILSSSFAPLQVGVRLQSEAPIVSPNAEQVHRRTKKNRLVRLSQQRSVPQKSGFGILVDKSGVYIASKVC